jgi:hypothetical protein
MKRISVLFVLTLALAPMAVRSAEISLADVTPSRGDKCVYKVFEQTSMVFEGTPVTSSSHGTGTETSEAVAVSAGSDRTVFMVLTSRAVETTHPDGKKDNSSSYSLETCRATKGGIWVDSSWAWENGEDASVDVGEKFLEMRIPCAPGTSWHGGRVTYKDGFTARPFCEAASYEDVQVPAGTFKNCLKVTSSTPDGLDGTILQGNQRLEIVSGKLDVTTWFYPRVGIVKEVSVTSLRLRPEGEEQAAILKMDSGTTLTLQEYKLGGK